MLIDTLKEKYDNREDIEAKLKCDQIYLILLNLTTRGRTDYTYTSDKNTTVDTINKIVEYFTLEGLSATSDLSMVPYTITLSGWASDIPPVQ